MVARTREIIGDTLCIAKLNIKHHYSLAVPVACISSLL